MSHSTPVAYNHLDKSRVIAIEKANDRALFLAATPLCCPSGTLNRSRSLRIDFGYTRCPRWEVGTSRFVLFVS